MIHVRCKVCNRELIGDNIHAKSCGCSNMTTVTEDRITAVDMTKVVLVKTDMASPSGNTLSDSDLMDQEMRRKRKVRKLDFEIR